MKTFLATSCGLLVMLMTSFASADLVYQTDFQTGFGGAPFNAGELQFQDGWLGQAGSIVDPGAGNVTAGITFRRNVNNNGALGTAIGSNTGPGFNVGDRIKITTDLAYSLGTNPNLDLSTIGIRDGFGGPDFGFEANPIAGGIRVAYSSFADGALKIYTGFDRNGFDGADNAFAVFVDAAEGGFDSGNNSGNVDLVTDPLQLMYEAEYTGSGFQATQLMVTNLTTGLVVADAAIENPMALEFSAYTGNDGYLAQRLLGNSPGSSAIQSSVTFEFFAVPEPSAAVIACSMLFGLVSRRRR